MSDIGGESLCLIFEGMQTPQKKGAKPNVPLKAIDLSLNQLSPKVEIRLETAMRFAIP